LVRIIHSAKSSNHSLSIVAFGSSLTKYLISLPHSSWIILL